MKYPTCLITHTVHAWCDATSQHTTFSRSILCSVVMSLWLSTFKLRRNLVDTHGCHAPLTQKYRTHTRGRLPFFSHVHIVGRWVWLTYN